MLDELFTERLGASRDASRYSPFDSLTSEMKRGLCIKQMAGRNALPLFPRDLGGRLRSDLPWRNRHVAQRRPAHAYAFTVAIYDYYERLRSSISRENRRAGGCIKVPTAGMRYVRVRVCVCVCVRVSRRFVSRVRARKMESRRR